MVRKKYQIAINFDKWDHLPGTKAVKADRIKLWGIWTPFIKVYLNTDL